MPTPDDTPPIFSPSLTLKTLKSFIPSLLVSTHRLSKSVAPASSFKLALHKGVLLFHLLQAAQARISVMFLTIVAKDNAGIFGSLCSYVGAVALQLMNMGINPLEIYILLV